MKTPQAIDDLNVFDEILENTSKESKLFVSRSLAIANQILHILDKKGMRQKDLADLLVKKEAEVSRWLTGFHNFTVKSIAKIEAALGEQIIFTAQESEQEVAKAVHALRITIPIAERVHSSRVTGGMVFSGRLSLKTDVLLHAETTRKVEFEHIEYAS